jgi:sec-independent protein translocase protein TatA
MGRLIEHPVPLLVLLLIVVLLFGAKRLPDVASGIAQSLRIFKREVRDGADEDKPAAAPAQPPVQQQVAQPPVAPQPAAPPAPAPEQQRPSDPSA